MLKMVDEVQYDIFRRVLAAIVSTGHGSNGFAIEQASKLTAEAVKQLKAEGIIAESSQSTA